MLRARPTHHRRHSSAASRAMTRASHTQQHHSSVLPVVSIDEQPGKGPLDGEHSSRQVSKVIPDAGSESSPSVSNLINEHASSSRNPVDAPMDDVMETLTSDLSSLKFVPPSVRFGRGGRRGGFAKS